MMRGHGQPLRHVLRMRSALTHSSKTLFKASDCRSNLNMAGSMDDVRMLNLVMQFLQERGLNETLETLSRETKHVMDIEGGGGQLCSILAEYEEMKLMEIAPEVDESLAALEQQLRSASADGSHAKMPAATVHEDVHGANIITVAVSSDESLLATGSTDRTIGIFSLASVVAQGPLQALAVLKVAEAVCLDISWGRAPGTQHLFFASFMSGEVAIVDARSGATLGKLKQHSKYSTRCQWNASCTLAASTSQDHTLALYETGPFVADSAAHGEEILRLRHSFSYLANPECCVFTRNGSTLIVAVRGDCNLHYINVHTLQAQKVNMNAMGDAHVSFTCMDLALSTDEQLLLAATDKSRIIMFATNSGHQLRNFYGAVNDIYTQCRVAWSPSNSYVYCTSQDHSVCVWEVATQRLVHRLKGHTKTLRDLDVISSTGSLVTGSFDRSVRVWNNLL